MRSFLLLRYICRSQNVMNNEMIAIEAQKYVLCIVAIHLSLPTM
jgi:hypothetical protein